jgi:radical SAM protein with 4Fe4S-binding SPASM domain
MSLNERLQTVLPLPAQITLYVAYPCNLRCKHCYLYGVADYVPEYMDRSMPQYMSEEIFRAAVDPLLESPTPLTVCFMGGEPVLHPRLADMVRHLKSRPHVYVDMNTNGTRMRKVGPALVEAGMDAIYVSLDGSSPEVNDPVRGRGSFRQAIEGLRFLAELRERESRPLKLAINYTITSENFRDLLPAAEMAESVGVDEIFFNLSIFVTEDEGKRAQRQLARLGHDFRSWQGFVLPSLVDDFPADLLEEHLNELQDRTWKTSVFMAPVGYPPAELRSYFTERWPKLLRQRSCPVQAFRTTVLPNGNVVPCTIYPDIVVGNLTEQPLEAVWLGERYNQFRQLAMRRLLPTCHRCCDLFDESAGDPFAFINGSRERFQIGAGLDQ